MFEVVWFAMPQEHWSVSLILSHEHVVFKTNAIDPQFENGSVLFISFL